MSTNTSTPKVKLQLVGLDGNIFSLIGAFHHAARHQGFAPSWIDSIVKQITSSSSYEDALVVLINNTEPPLVEDIDDEDEDFDFEDDYEEEEDEDIY